MNTFKPSTYELVKYEEDRSEEWEGKGKLQKRLRHRMNIKVLEHCGAVCAGLVANTTDVDKRVAVRVMEFTDGEELSLKYMNKLFGVDPREKNEEYREIEPLSDALEIELEGKDSDREQEEIMKENTNRIQQNLRHLVNELKPARKIHSVSEFDDPLCANVRNSYNGYDGAFWIWTKKKLKMFHPAQLNKLDRALKVVEGLNPETRELNAGKLLASLDRKDRRKVAKMTEDADGDKDRDSDCDSESGSDGEDIDWDEHGYETDWSGDSDWEEYVKDCTYRTDRDNYRRAGRMLRERTLETELFKAVLPNGLAPIWLKRLASQLFLDLERDESIIKAIHMFLDGDKDVEGCWDFNRLLFLRRDNLSAIQQALCAMAIFAEFMSGNETLYRCVRDVIAGLNCEVNGLSLTILKLDVMMERLLVISKKEGEAPQLHSDAFSCRDRASFQHADVVESLVPGWIGPFEKWLMSVLALSADNASHDSLSFETIIVIVGLLR